MSLRDSQLLALTVIRASSLLAVIFAVLALH